MTTDEIKTLIAQTISGQGDAVDVGGGLAKILNALVEASLNVMYLDDIQFVSGKATITGEQFSALADMQVLIYDGIQYMKIGAIPDGVLSSIAEQYGVTGSSMWGTMVYLDNFSVDSAEGFLLGIDGNNMPTLLHIQL